MDGLKKIGNNVLITESEINVLQKYGISVNKNANIDEVLFLIDMFLNAAYDLTDEEYNEIDFVANNLAERKYYMGTNK